MATLSRDTKFANGAICENFLREIREIERFAKILSRENFPLYGKRPVRVIPNTPSIYGIISLFVEDGAKTDCYASA